LQYKRINWFFLNRTEDNLNNNNAENKIYVFQYRLRDDDDDTNSLNIYMIILLSDLQRFSSHYLSSTLVISLHSHHWFISSCIFLFYFLLFLFVVSVVFALLKVVSGRYIIDFQLVYHLYGDTTPRRAGDDDDDDDDDDDENNSWKKPSRTSAIKYNSNTTD